MYVQVTSKDPHSHLKSLYPENRIVAWDDLPDGSKHVRSAFVTSQVFVILALAFALALILFLFFGLIVRRTATACARVLHGNGKWIAVVFALCAFVFALLAWTLFFRFPSALGDDGLCPAAMFDDLDGPLWCRSRKIAGMGAHHDVPFKLSWTGTNQTVNVDAHFTWAPSVLTDAHAHAFSSLRADVSCVRACARARARCCGDARSDGSSACSPRACCYPSSSSRPACVRRRTRSGSRGATARWAATPARWASSSDLRRRRHSRAVVDTTLSGEVTTISASTTHSCT
jgi:hypothetical protein